MQFFKAVVIAASASLLTFTPEPTLSHSGSLAGEPAPALASMSGVDRLNRNEMLDKARRQPGERPWVAAEVRNVNSQRAGPVRYNAK